MGVEIEEGFSGGGGVVAVSCCGGEEQETDEMEAINVVVEGGVCGGMEHAVAGEKNAGYCEILEGGVIVVICPLSLFGFPYA